MKKVSALFLALVLALLGAITALGADALTDKSAWKVTVSSEKTGFPAQRIIDGNESTYWHSDYTSTTVKVTEPHDIDITLPSKTLISGLRYTPRTDNTSGIVQEYDIYAADTDSGAWTLIATGTMPGDYSKQDVKFAVNVPVKKLRFRITKGMWNYGTCAELDFYAQDASKKSVSTVAEASQAANLGGRTLSKSQAGYVPRAGWKVTASSTYKNKTADLAIDGNAATYWHSGYVDENNTIVSKDEAPFRLTFTLPEVTAISGIEYTPRTDTSSAGIVKAYKIYVSESDNGNAKEIFSGTMAGDRQVQTVKFGFDVKVKTLVFEITEGQAGYGTCAEFNMLAAAGSGGQTSTGASGTQTNISRTSWKVTASSTYKNRTADLMIDGDTSTYWHSGYVDENNTIVSKDEAPFRLTFTLPQATAISGIEYTPRQDNNEAGIVLSYKIYVSETDEGQAREIASGTMPGGHGVQTVKFGAEVKVKTLVFEILEGKFGYGTCAEFNMLSASGSAAASTSGISGGSSVEIPVEEKTIGGVPLLSNKARWDITASSQHAPNVAKRAIDGDETTYWHTDYTDDGKATILTKVPGPHWIEITLPEVTEISGFVYTPRTSNNTGMISEYTFYAAESESADWVEITQGSFPTDKQKKIVSFIQNISVKRIRFVSEASVNDYGVIVEFDLFGHNDRLDKAESLKTYADYAIGNAPVKLPFDQMQATASSVWRHSMQANNVLDGKRKSVWHSDTEDKNKFPVTLAVDLGQAYDLVQILYYPRTEDEGGINGVWKDFNIWASLDGENYELAKEHCQFETSLDTKSILFDEPLTTRYLEFEILNGVNGYATCADLEFYEAASSAKNRTEDNRYVLQIGSNKIITTKDGETTEKTIDVAPFIDSDYTQIPLRGLLEEMGAEITWDGQKQKIDIQKGNVEIHLQIGNDLVYVSNVKYGMIRYTLEVAPQIRDSRTFIPLRFISENLGYTVLWDGETRTITITE